MLIATYVARATTEKIMFFVSNAHHYRKRIGAAKPSSRNLYHDPRFKPHGVSLGVLPQVSKSTHCLKDPSRTAQPAARFEPLRTEQAQRIAEPVAREDGAQILLA